MTRLQCFILTCLCLYLVGCGDEEEIPAQQLVTPALTPEKMCSLRIDAINEDPEVVTCDFQAQTGCGEGQVCAYIWPEPAQGSGLEFTDGYCTTPCETDAECTKGTCRSARWGRCPSGLLCYADLNCREAWEAVCNDPEEPITDPNSPAACNFNEEDYCKPL